VPTNRKIVLQRQTAHADAVAGLALPGLRRAAELVRSTRLQTFLTVLNFHPLSCRITGNNGFWRLFPLLVGPTKLLNNVSKTLIAKNQTVIDCLQLSDTETRNNEKLKLFPKSCIFIFWLNRPTQNLTGWKWWVLVEKLMPFDEILR